MDRAKDICFPIFTFIVLIAAWSFAIQWFEVPNYLAPTPSAVWDALLRGYVDGVFWPHLLFTARATAVGYVLGCLMALLLGAVLAESRTFERFTYPYIVALQSMPKIALAPLIIVWFGFGIESKIVTVALICFFPLFVNTVVGIRQTSPALLELMSAFSASRARAFFTAKLPSAAGHIFAGLQISIVLSLIGAIAAEFVSSTQGLGYLIKASSVSSDVDVMFAALFSLALIGVGGSQLVRMVHRFAVFWDRGERTTTIAEG